jgi:hypothetical protein
MASRITERAGELGFAGQQALVWQGQGTAKLRGKARFGPSARQQLRPQGHTATNIRRLRAQTKVALQAAVGLRTYGNINGEFGPRQGFHAEQGTKRGHIGVAQLQVIELAQIGRTEAEP